MTESWRPPTRLLRVATLALSLWGVLVLAPCGEAAASRAAVERVQPRVVKIYGAGGLRGLEAYQSGVLVSAEGHILTTWSYVLDTEAVTVILDDGRKFEADLLGADPVLEIAVLKIDAEDLSFFDLAAAVEGDTGMRVLAFSNLYGVATGDERVSVQRGVVAAVTTLAGRQGAFVTPYRGRVYVVDAITNNPGATGGALTDIRGQLLGILGKELRDRRSQAWLNYAVPIAELREAVSDIRAGKFRRRDPAKERLARNPLDLTAFGIVFVPNVVDSTPAYVDAVRPDSSAATSGLQPDDLVLFVGGVLIRSLRDLREQAKLIEQPAEISLIVRRGEELKTVMLQSTDAEAEVGEPREGEQP